MNPFREIIVSDPWRAAAVDVPEIQADVFDECLRGVEHVRRAGRSAGLLIHGAAGSGKTHLLSRLRTHLTLQAPTATDRDECLFVWVRLQASPRMIWRHVRRMLVEDWFRPVRGQRTQFERILFHRLAEIRVAEGDLEPWYEFMRDEKPTELDELLERVADNLYLDRNTTIAFKHLAFERHRRDLRAWLGGDSLPEEALAQLGLSQDEGTDEEREHEARRIVLMLCRLAGDGLPIVLSLDQVEALQASADDREGLFAFGQLASTLHDETSNVLVVSCVQSAFATELKDKSRGADYARMTSLGARSLATLTRPQTEKLIAARLALADPAFRHPVPTDPLWPLELADFNRLTAVDELTPRRLLATCADRFEICAARDLSPVPSSAPLDAGGPLLHDVKTAVQPIANFLDDEWKSRVEQSLSANRPERTEEIVRHALPLLITLIAPEWKPVHDELLPDVPLLFQGPRGRTGLSIRTEPNMRTVGAKLGRLAQQLALGRMARLIVLRDSRVPLTKAAKGARKNLDDLEQRGAIVVHPAPEVLAALDALRALLSDAKSGDLARDGETVSPQTVEEWLKSQLPDELREFAQQLTGVSPTSAEPPAHDWLDLEELAALLVEQPVLPLDKASELLKRPAATIVATIQRHPDRFGLLAGPPAIMFRVTSVAN